MLSKKKTSPTAETLLSGVNFFTAFIDSRPTGWQSSYMKYQRALKFLGYTEKGQIRLTNKRVRIASKAGVVPTSETVYEQFDYLSKKCLPF